MNTPSEHPMKKYRDLDRERGKKRVNITLTKEEYQFLLKKSAQSGETPTAYIKNVALHHMANKRHLNQEELEIFREAIIELIRIGNNLNQIAHQANIGNIPAPEEVRDLMQLLESHVKTYFTKD